jgi:hypothetical protein
MEEEAESPFKAHHEEAAEEHTDRWGAKCAILSAILAVCAALSSLYSGHFANEAMLEEIQASDQWNYYQSKGVKAAISEFNHDKEKIEHYQLEQASIKEKADELSVEASRNLKRHEWLASAVTVLQVAIALTAIAVLSRQRYFLVFVLLLTTAGGCFSVLAAIVH